MTERKLNFERIGWFLIGGLTIVAIVFNYYYSTQPLVLHLASWLGWAVLVILIAWKTHSGQRFLNFARESHDELRRVVWPTRQETLQTTLVVVIMVAIASLMLWGLDAILLWIVGLLTGQRG